MISITTKTHPSPNRNSGIVPPWLDGSVRVKNPGIVPPWLRSPIRILPVDEPEDAILPIGRTEFVQHESSDVSPTSLADALRGR